MPQLKKETLKQTLFSVLNKDIMLCSGGSAVYSTFAKETDIAHKALKMSAGIRVIDKVFHIQNVNAYHSRQRMDSQISWRGNQVFAKLLGMATYN